MKRIAIVCPGRGSYAEAQLGSLPREHPWLARADELRAEYMLPALSELDRAERFDKGVHLRAANASPLIWLVSMLDAAQAMQDASVACVAGNSLGWYTALAVAGALDFETGFRLVQEMALAQERLRGGGQILYPRVDENWLPDRERERAVEDALASASGDAFRSIELGGFAVLAGTDVGIEHLMRSLPPAQLGRNRYPFKLIGHGPYHTPLVMDIADRARAHLARLEWRTPTTTLVDGRGRRFTPWSTGVEELRDYTFREQLIAPYDFTRSIHVVLREHAPDELVLPGPGNTLGSICGQILVREGWHGVRSKADFDRLQASGDAFVRSMRR